ncbi:hypothetical protein F8388_021175 [Cannabis sativa]|uniref:Uncharacterized protein n=1 Tax=Cannabis sativa TaxID=3483 RepID=A0A7J6GFE0_CANSA|nr:hypothetical protein F8388_021175 [Cannabis sativa]
MCAILNLFTVAVNDFADMIVVLRKEFEIQWLMSRLVPLYGEWLKSNDKRKDCFTVEEPLMPRSHTKNGSIIDDYGKDHVYKADVTNDDVRLKVENTVELRDGQWCEVIPVGFVDIHRETKKKVVRDGDVHRRPAIGDGREIRGFCGRKLNEGRINRDDRDFELHDSNDGALKFEMDNANCDSEELDGGGLLLMWKAILEVSIESSLRFHIDSIIRNTNGQGGSPQVLEVMARKEMFKNIDVPTKVTDEINLALMALFTEDDCGAGSERYV